MQRNTYEYQKIRSIERKLYLLYLRGSCCEKCGYDKNLAAIDFHHKDPTVKKFQLDSRTLSNNSMETIMVEFSKCEALCANCHRELHSPESELAILFDKVDDFKNSIRVKLKRPINKNKCIDCGTDINYGYTRCRACKCVASRIKPPALDVLETEAMTHGCAWCGRKYEVSVTTVRRWLGVRK